MEAESILKSHLGRTIDALRFRVKETNASAALETYNPLILTTTRRNLDVGLQELEEESLCRTSLSLRRCSAAREAACGLDA
jgi:hypothetical protein